MPGNLFEGNPVDEGTTRMGTDTPVHRPEKPALLGNCGPSFTNTMPELTWHSENAQYVVADIFFF